MDSEITTQEIVRRFAEFLTSPQPLPSTQVASESLYPGVGFMHRLADLLRDPCDRTDIRKEMLAPLQVAIASRRLPIPGQNAYESGLLAGLEMLLEYDKVYQLKLRAGHELGEEAFAILGLILQGGGSASLRHIEIVYDLSKRGCALHVSALERAGFVDKPREDIANYVQITADGRRFLEAVESGQIRA